MLREDWTEMLLHAVAHYYFVQRARGQITNDTFNKINVGHALYHLHKLKRGRAKLYALCSRFIKRAINDVRPSYERFERRVFKLKTLARYLRNKLCAGFALRV